MVYVIKANGEKAEFERAKIVQTCKRAGVPDNVAEKIASEVESRVRDGTRTRAILGWVLRKLEEYEAHHSSKYNLKLAIANLHPGEHEFEKYVEHLLRAHGYKTKWDLIIQGECIEHQMDIVAEKDRKKYLVECKHHINPHRFSGLGTSLELWAVLDDIQKAGKDYENAWLFVNTKFSEHATKYATAKKMILTGWNYPKGNDLRGMVENKGLYPVTILKLGREARKKFIKSGIILLKELVETPLGELKGKTSLDKRTLSKLVGAANKVLKS